MTLAEIEKEMYINTLRIRSIEAWTERVPPFSKEFETLIEESIKTQKAQETLFVMRHQELCRMYDAGRLQPSAETDEEN